MPNATGPGSRDRFDHLWRAAARILSMVLACLGLVALPSAPAIAATTFTCSAAFYQVTATNGGTFQKYDVPVIQGE